MTEFLQRRKIKNQITDRDTYAWCILFRLKHAEGKILNRKMRIFCDFEKRAKSHAYDLTTKSHRGHEDLFEFSLSSTS